MTEKHRLDLVYCTYEYVFWPRKLNCISCIGYLLSSVLQLKILWIETQIP